MNSSNKPKFSVAITTKGYQGLINSTLGDPEKARRFCASITSAVAVNPQLQECDAGTILAGALLGESLNLSPSPQLGQYYLVPFNDKKTDIESSGTVECEICLYGEAINYALTTAEPDDWESSYTSYFTYDGVNYTPISSAQPPEWLGDTYYSVVYRIITSPSFCIIAEGRVYSDSEVESQDEFTALTTAIEECSNIDISVSKEGSVATVAVTKKDGTEQSITVSDGAQGAKGDNGEKGEKGDTGNTGAQGPKGDTGDTGTDGVSPTVSVSQQGYVTTISVTDVNGTANTEINEMGPIIGTKEKNVIIIDDASTFNTANYVFKVDGMNDGKLRVHSKNFLPETINSLSGWVQDADARSFHYDLINLPFGYYTLSAVIASTEEVNAFGIFRVARKANGQDTWEGAYATLAVNLNAFSPVKFLVEPGYSYKLTFWKSPALAFNCYSRIQLKYSSTQSSASEPASEYSSAYFYHDFPIQDEQFSFYNSESVLYHVNDDGIPTGDELFVEYCRSTSIVIERLEAAILSLGANI